MAARVRRPLPINPYRAGLVRSSRRPAAIRLNPTVGNRVTRTGTPMFRNRSPYEYAAYSRRPPPRKFAYSVSPTGAPAASYAASSSYVQQAQALADSVIDQANQFIADHHDQIAAGEDYYNKLQGYGSYFGVNLPDLDKILPPELIINTAKPAKGRGKGKGKSRATRRR